MNMFAWCLVKYGMICLSIAKSLVNIQKNFCSKTYALPTIFGFSTFYKNCFQEINRKTNIRIFFVLLFLLIKLFVNSNDVVATIKYFFAQ